MTVLVATNNIFLQSRAIICRKPKRHRRKGRNPTQQLLDVSKTCRASTLLDCGMLADRKAVCRKVMMVKTLQINSDGLRVIVLRCVIVIGFGVSLLLLSSVEVLDAIAIVSIVATQVLLGGLIWRKIRDSAPIEIAEFLGMGSAVGFSLALISSQVFREILPRSIAWLVLLLVVCGLCYFVKNRSLTDEAPVVKSEIKSEPKFGRVARS